MHFNVGFLLTNSAVNAVVRVQLSFSPTFSSGNEYYSTRNPFHSLFHSIKHKYATESKKKWLVLFIVCLLRAAQFRISLLRMHFALSLSLSLNLHCRERFLFQLLSLTITRLGFVASRHCNKRKRLEFI